MIIIIIVIVMIVIVINSNRLPGTHQVRGHADAVAQACNIV